MQRQTRTSVSERLSRTSVSTTATYLSCGMSNWKGNAFFPDSELVTQRSGELQTVFHSAVLKKIFFPDRKIFQIDLIFKKKKKVKHCCWQVLEENRFFFLKFIKSWIIIDFNLLMIFLGVSFSENWLKTSTFNFFLKDFLYLLKRGNANWLRSLQIKASLLFLLLKLKMSSWNQSEIISKLYI